MVHKPPRLYEQYDLIIITKLEIF